MFNKNFYPTPDEQIEKMLEGIDFDHRMVIMEPSAGKGNILDYLNRIIHVKYYGYDRDGRYGHESNYERLYCIESDPELRQILIGKNYRLIDTDWLSHKPERNYDLIVMNPPFDQGHKHLLHAMESSPEADIRCLLNKQTINNPYTQEHKLMLSMLETRDHEIVEMGNSFSSAERSTNVEVVLIKVKGIEQEKKFNFDFSGMTDKENLYTVKDIKSNQVETRDVFGSLVHRYDKVKELAAEMQSIRAEMLFYANGLIANDDCFKKLGEGQYEPFLDELRISAWENVYSETKLGDIITASVKKEITSSQENHRHTAFTEQNIYELLATLTGSLNSIKAKCIQEAFDNLTKYHDENRGVLEGWKTNTAWIVKEKCIFPFSVTFWGKGPAVTYQKGEMLEDIEKALCMLSGKVFTDVRDDCLYESSRQLAPDGEPRKTGVWYDSEFFTYKMFKKGTIHLKFKDLDLLKRFNYEVCKNKNWIGGGFG